MFYHKGKKTQCKAHLDVSLKELQKNIVDDNKVTELMTMGFSATQARLALKTTGGNIEAAIESIMKVLLVAKFESWYLKNNKFFGVIRIKK